MQGYDDTFAVRPSGYSGPRCRPPSARRRRRGSTSSTRSRSWMPAATRPSGPSAISSRCRRTSSATATRSSARSCCPAPPARAAGREAELHALDAHINGVRWGGAFVVDKPGRWEWAVEAWTDLFATWRDELRRKLEAGQHDLASELSEGVLLLRGRRRAGQGRRQAADRARAADPDRRGDPRGGQARRRAGHGALRRRRAQRRAPGRDPAGAGADAGGRPGARPLRLLVRAVPALLRRDRRRPGRAAQARRPGLRRGLPAADPPDRPDQPQGPQQRARRRRPRIPARRTGSARRPAGTTRCTPTWARTTTCARCAPRRPSSTWTSRSTWPSTPRRTTLAQGAPGLVPPPPGRHAEVRREPAQEVPGHLQRQLGHARLAGALGRARAGRAAVGRPRREGVPRRQPAHEADPVLAVADRARCTRSTAT